MVFSKDAVKTGVFLACLFLMGFMAAEAEAANGSVSGTVYVTETGFGLGGVTVTARKQFDDWSDAGSGVTAGDGTYSITGLPPGEYALRSKLATYGTAILHPVFINSGQDTPSQDLSMSNNPGSISGTVMSTGGSPVPLENMSMNCQLHTPAGRWAFVDYILSDVNGDFVFNDLNPAGAYIVSVHDGNNDGTDYHGRRRFQVSVAAGANTVVDFDLGLAATVTGKVTNATTASPIQDVAVDFRVRGNEEIMTGWDTTDASGDYEIRFLEPGYNYSVYVKPPTSTSYVMKSMYFDVPAESSYSLDIALDDDAITIDGLVTDANTGSPLENTRVSYWHEDSDVWQDAYSDATGYYILTNLPKGEASVQAIPASTYAQKRIQDDFMTSTTVNFALALASTISGEVRALDTGEPFVDVRVHAENKDGGWYEAWTQSDGSFLLNGLSEGINQLRVDVAADTGYAQQFKFVYTAESENVTGVTFLLEAGALVSGRVEDPSTVGIPNIHVSAKGPGRDSARAKADSYGNFEMRLTPGAHTVSIEVEGQYTALPAIVDIADANDNKAITITAFTEATGAEHINGTILNAGPYPHVNGFGVAAFSAGYVIDETTIERAQPLSFAMLQTAGSYDLLVPPGITCDLYLVLGVPETDVTYAGTLTMRDKLTSVPAGSTGQDLAYDSEGGTVSGTVTDNGNPVCMAIVYLLDVNDELAGFAYTDQNGAYTFYNVPAGGYVPAGGSLLQSMGSGFPMGPYTIGAWHEDYGYSEEEVPVEGLTDGGTVVAPTIILIKDWILNMAEMPWYENVADYFSTGAATCQMILNYIREGAGVTTLDSQNELYEYTRPYDGTELNPDDIDKILGHYDPYDTLVTNGYDDYDTLPDGNPYQGYNFMIDTHDPVVAPDAIHEYMRDICHWMAYTVTQENWWEDGDLVARPNTPAALPLYGTYDHWVAVQGCATSAHPCPEPRTDPWNTPDFTVHCFWVKDPLTSGIGQTAYITAAECEETYFKPLGATGDEYAGLFVQVAEPPSVMSKATIEIPSPVKDVANLEFIGVESRTKEEKASKQLMSMSLSMVADEEPIVKKKGWKDLVDSHLLTDDEAVAAFEGTKMKRPFLVHRLDKENADYYLVPFAKKGGRRYLTSAVVILDSKEGYFKEASWTQKPERFLNVTKQKAMRLIRRSVYDTMRDELRQIPRRPKRKYSRERMKIWRKYAKLFRYTKNAQAQLVWEPNSYSTSPYKPYWKVDMNGYVWYVTQEKEIIPQDEIAVIVGEIEANTMLMNRYFRR